MNAFFLGAARQETVPKSATILQFNDRCIRLGSSITLFTVHGIGLDPESGFTIDTHIEGPQCDVVRHIVAPGESEPDLYTGKDAVYAHLAEWHPQRNP